MQKSKENRKMLMIRNMQKSKQNGGSCTSFRADSPPILRRSSFHMEKTAFHSLSMKRECIRMNKITHLFFFFLTSFPFFLFFFRFYLTFLFFSSAALFSFSFSSVFFILSSFPLKPTDPRCRRKGERERKREREKERERERGREWVGEIKRGTTSPSARHEDF